MSLYLQVARFILTQDAFLLLAPILSREARILIWWRNRGRPRRRCIRYYCSTISNPNRMLRIIDRTVRLSKAAETSTTKIMQWQVFVQSLSTRSSFFKLLARCIARIGQAVCTNGVKCDRSALFPHRYLIVCSCTQGKPVNERKINRLINYYPSRLQNCTKVYWKRTSR